MEGNSGLTLLPARTVCGVTSFAVVNVIAVCHVVVNLTVLGSISSVHPVVMGGVLVYPWQQVLLGLHVLIGFPFILAGVAASLFRLTDLMNAYFKYMCLSVGVLLLFLVAFIQQGGFCEPSGLQRSAEGRMTCFLTSLIMSSVLLLPILIGMGVIYVVWSAAQLCREPIPELSLYRQKLEQQEMPEPYQQPRPALVPDLAGGAETSCSRWSATPGGVVGSAVLSGWHSDQPAFVAAPSYARAMHSARSSRPVASPIGPGVTPFFTAAPVVRIGQSTPIRCAVPNYGSQLLGSSVLRK
jgi:hypothetical protein